MRQRRRPPQGFVVAVIRYGPGRRPCRWLCPCPHPADVEETFDTDKAEKPPAAQHAIPAHRPAADPEESSPSSRAARRGAGAGRHHEVPGTGDPAVRGPAGGTDRVALVPAVARTEALAGGMSGTEASTPAATPWRPATAMVLTCTTRLCVGVAAARTGRPGAAACG
ncbi:DUF6248 family natural product biosynthesis protein [Streptomyces sp. 1222.2]|uniref:DUF6248 family natural product biosynthesis protein n=1 Tax=Streptomyces sp. 1222.2 TaxID=1938833 RepID=UPI00359C83E8